jgi:probable F420-dependent oxidoreductase
MRMGFGLPVSGSWATPRNVALVAGRADELGYATLWSFQRLLVPVGSPLGPQYRSVADPLLPLAFAAAVTRRTRLGAAVVNMPFQAPPVLAKQLATLDVLSGGRAVAGLGLGWVPEEFEAVGVPYERRGARGEEYVAALRALWGPDPVAFEGEFYRVPEASMLPKPVQPAGPPVLLGGGAPKALERVGRLADGWISSSRADPETIDLPVNAVKDAARAAGRDPEALEFVVRGVVRTGPRTGPLTGTLDEIAADLPAIAAKGVTELFVDLNFDPSIGNPEADPAASMSRALETLEALAPGAAPTPS